MMRLPRLLDILLHRPRVERDLDDEVRAYLDLLTDEKIGAGMTPEAARRQALIELGGVERVKEEVRDVRAGHAFETMFQDLRYGLRVLARNRGFTAVAALSLALGIGGNAAMFSLVNRLYIQDLPYPEPQRLVRVTVSYPKGALAVIRKTARTMDVAGFTTDSEFNVSAEGEAVRVAGSVVSANLFSLLGARAEIGRTFTAGEDEPGRDGIVLLSDRLWRDQFGANPAVLGSSIRIDGVERRVVGVMPPDFEFPSSGSRLWIPLHLDPGAPGDYWGAGFMPLVGRLRDGATIEAARSEIQGLVARIIPMFPYTMARTWNADAGVLPLQSDLVGGIRNRVLVLSCAVAIVLLIACANVASILLARAAARRGEIALRGSLGAARGRIVRQLLTESVLLAGAGGVLGLALASGAVWALKSALPADTPRLSGAGLDWSVALFTALVSIATGLAFGAAPAIASSRWSVAELINGGRRSTTVAGIRARNWLVGGEVALAFMLVLSAGLLIRSLWQLTQADPGFRPEHLVTARISPAQSACADRTGCVEFYDRLLQQARGITGVSAVAAENALPSVGIQSAVPILIEDQPIDDRADLAPLVQGAAVTPEFFSIMRIPLLAGRRFTDADRQDSARVVIVSAAAARRFWPRESALDKRIKPTWDAEWRTVVGIAGDVRGYAPSGAPSPDNGVIYMPYPQAVGLNRQLPAAMTLVARTAADPSRVARDVARIVSKLNPDVPVGEVKTMEAVVSASTSRARSLAWLFAGFGGSALLLAAIGIYGVVAYSAAQRTYEMGVRIALGATRGSILEMVIRQSLRSVLIGVGAGAIASFALARLLAGLLYGVAATDPATYAAVAALVAGVALVAAYVPARRAAAVDPVAALRVD